MGYAANVAAETGWSCEFVLWELSFAVGLGVMHAAGVRNGETMVFESVDSAVVVDDFREGLRRMREREGVDVVGRVE
jgi:hypothetical protein